MPDNTRGHPGDPDPDDERPTDPPPDDIGRTDRPTLVPCLACDGDYARSEETGDGRYRMSACSWCTQGGMNEAQRHAWAEGRASRRAAAPAGRGEDGGDGEDDGR